MFACRLYCLAVALVFPLLAVGAQVPFADDLPVTVKHYNRAAPMVATAGAPAVEDLAALKQAGIEVLVDFRRPQEGTAAYAAAAEELGLAFHHLPMGREQPDKEQVSALSAILEKHQDQPVLLYCASGNRAGTMWALHLLESGASADQAIAAGLTAGMAGSRVEWITAWE
ncbi:MAG: hypothetical protein Tsb002_25920 [Wenzhouxiangellaceae bacterium]